jgi:superfamily II DNA/RNA helicase
VGPRRFGERMIPDHKNLDDPSARRPVEAVTSVAPVAVESQLGAYFSSGIRRTACDGRVEFYLWRLDPAAPGFTRTVARRLGEAYVLPAERLRFPKAPLTPKLPAREKTTRKGDLGEVLAGALFSRRIGRAVPFEKLSAKPVAGATLHGPDLFALSLAHGDPPRPTVVEVKVRPTISPAKDLGMIKSSLKKANDDYLLSAWVAGVQQMGSHPEDSKIYALSAAQSLAGLTQPTGEFPPHERQAVIVADRNNIKGSQIETAWEDDPPVTVLHVITLGDVEAVIDDVFDEAAGLTYGDLASGVPQPPDGQRHTPGVTAPLSSSDAMAMIERVRDGTMTGLGALVEAALWQLADWDGMAHARATQLIESTSDPTIKGLGQLLTGAVGGASRTFGRQAVLGDLAAALSRAWNRQINLDELRARSEAVVARLDDPEGGDQGVGNQDLAVVVRYITAANAHRLTRHPVTLVEAAGATGPHVHAIVERMQSFRQAFWPSQAQAIEGGLLDQAHPSLAVKMPTSAGKTRLIELLAADTLDADETAAVAVIAPTNALVGQLGSDLRRALADAEVRSSHGGLDFDTDDPAVTGRLTDPGVAVMTPERFDLEWRRLGSSDEREALAQIQLLIVDEAHLLTETNRGARLELVVARALRAGIRVVLLSSQFPDTSKLSEWLGGEEVSSTWGPTWLRRFVYYRSPDKATGYLQPDSGPPVEMFGLKPTPPEGSEVVRRARPAEAAALATRYAAEGLTVVFTNQRRHVDNLVKEATAAFDDESSPTVPRDVLEQAARMAPDLLDALAKGVGVHHANVPRDMRRLVETAARKDQLRCIVCTSTLLEGVDFPTRTVIAAYPPQDFHGKPQVARLRNLAGRAGRGGRFTSGTLVVMANEEAKARSWFRAFRTDLPPTRSALSDALRQLRGLARHIQTVDPATDTSDTLAAIDALIVAALAEGATIDGDLRQTLEELLGRTLWAVGMDAARRDPVLSIAAQRAQRLQVMFKADHWQKAFYRSGLPMQSCNALRGAVAPLTVSITAAAGSPAFDADEWLIRLATEVAPQAAVLSRWGDLDRSELSTALASWLVGTPVADIETAHPDVWAAIQFDLDGLVPWVLTAAIDFIATEVVDDAADPEVRDLLYHKLQITRLRYGVPRGDLCEPVRRGCDRVKAVGLASEYSQLSVWDRLSEPIGDYIERRLEEEAEAAATEVAARLTQPTEAADTPDAI